MSRVIWYSGHDVLVRDIVRAENCSLFDSSGREYLDLESGVWCTSVGHGNPRVLAAIAEQSARIAHAGFCYSTSVVEEAAREVLLLLEYERGSCIFLNSGSEAVEYAVRVAQAVSDRPLLLIMQDSYCGAYGSASEKRPEAWFSFDWGECSDCRSTMSCDERCPRWSQIPWDQIGGFLLEPGSSSGFVRFPPEKLVGAIARRLAESGGLLLVNEVTTGVGRTGEWFGYQHYGVRPEIVALGKGIGNGYPVSVTALSSRVAERLSAAPVTYAQSHQNDPMGAAVVVAVIGCIRDGNLLARARGEGDRLRNGLEEIRARTGRIEAIRGRGLMFAIDIADASDAPAYAAYIHEELVRRGFILARRPRTNTLRLDPPLTIEGEQVRRFLYALEAALEGEP